MKKKRTGKIRRQMDEYMEEHKCCERCVSRSLLLDATDCHHIKPVGMGGAPAESPLHSHDNLIGLCHLCHDWAHKSIKTTKEELMRHKENYKKNLREAIIAGI